jgi:PAS domain S-box-containing protein
VKPFKESRFAYLLNVAILASVYFAFGRLALEIGVIREGIALIWPPSGIALAALLISGYRLWPGVALGAFLLSLGVGWPLGVACGITVVNTLETLLAAWFLKEVTGFRNAFGRITEVTALFILAAGLSPLVSACLGCAVLCWGGLASWQEYHGLWLGLWQGHAIPMFIVPPLILSWVAEWRVVWRAPRLIEGTALWTLTFASGLFAFGLSNPETGEHPVFYVVFPFIVWAALRFGTRGAATATFIIHLLTVTRTAAGMGPFASETLPETISGIWGFMGVVAFTGLMLAAVVTERRRALQTLAAREAELKLFHQQIPSVLWATDDSLLLQEVFGSGSLEAGTGRGNLRGKTIQEVVKSHDSGQAVIEIHQRALKGESGKCETRVGGQILDIRVEPRRDFEGRIIGCIGMGMNITDRKTAEERYRQSEVNLAEAQRVALVGSWNWDIATNVVTWSDELCRIYGLKPGEFTPSFQAFLDHAHPEDRADADAVMRKALRNRTPFSNYHRVVRPDGTVRFIHGLGRVEIDANGRPVRMYGTGQDITEIRQAQALLAGEKRVLEAISRRVPLDRVLQILARTVEEQSEGLICSILLLDAEGTHLKNGASPSLPGAYCQAIEGIAIGPSVGSCGTAAYRKEPVFVRDISLDPLWSEFRDLALSHGLRGCSSMPIFSTSEEILGTFAVYYREPRTPSPRELELIERASHLAGIAIERERMEEEARRSEEMFRTISEQLPDCLLLVDIDDPDVPSKIAGVNEAACRIHGYKREEMIGRSTAMLATPETTLLIPSRLERVLKGELVSFEGMHRKKGGTTFPVEVTGQMLNCGGRRIVLSLARDLTERKRFEAALRLIVEGTASATGDEFFRALVRSLASVLGVQYAFISELADEIGTKGRTLASWIGNEFGEDFEYDMDGTPCGQAVREGFCFYPEGVVSHFPADPLLEEMGVESYAGVPLFDSNCVCVGVMAVLDHSPMRERELVKSIMKIFGARAGAELSRIRTEENRLVIERKLSETQKLESLGLLAGGIAHDFNNILTTVMGNVTMAKADVSELSPIRPYLESIETATQNAADLARQMLAYSGRGAFNIKPLDLNGLITEMGHLLEVALPKSVSLNYRLGADLPAIQADSTQLRQVVMNLVLNAGEAVGKKPGLITVVTGSIKVDHDYLCDFARPDLSPGEYVSLQISDNGCGMDKETQARIFDPFFTTKFTGRGLGLAAVLGIVRSHGGALKVYSEPNQGTTFKILLPRSEAPVAEATSSRRVGIEKVSGLVLVVDDEETVRVVVHRILVNAGYDVLLATNGAEGVEMFRKNRVDIDLTLLDMTMPDMNGEETFSEIRRLDNSAVVLLMSGYSEQEATVEFAGKGLAGFLQKPFRRDDLLEVVQDSITMRQCGA